MRTVSKRKNIWSLQCKYIHTLKKCNNRNTIKKSMANKFATFPQLLDLITLCVLCDVFFLCALCDPVFLVPQTVYSNLLPHL